MPQFIDSTGHGYWAKKAASEGDRELGRTDKWDKVAGDKAGGGKLMETGADEGEEKAKPSVKRSKKK